MNKLLKQIQSNPTLVASIQKCETEVTPILQGYITNFPEFTDHSINHSKTVLGYIELLLGNESKKLNDEEVYILIMAGFLHDIGMCPTTKMKKDIKESSEFKQSGKPFEDYLRDIHHRLSYEYIITHWKKLHIINEVYAEAIGLVGMGHRVVDLFDFDRYAPEYPVKSGADTVCLPYLAGTLRLADELDITNDRTPDLLYSEYFPINKISKKEWEKHKANYFVTFSKPAIKITSKCFEKDLYYALLKQYNKIDEVIKYVQKLINTIPGNSRELKINYFKIEKEIKTYGFIPKDIGFSFDLQNTINTFIGKNLYKDRFVAIRECLQNSIDTCRYRKKLSRSQFIPKIEILLEKNQLTVSDNGVGMNSFIIENYFSKLSKSYYSETKVSNDFEAISQFGIGVFSYFLLCDYFDVESKQEGESPIKFRATKDAGSYFHFYDNATRDNVGTSIIFNLTNEMTFDELVKQVTHYIRFVEFPILIQSGNREKTITSRNYLIDKFQVLDENKGREDVKILSQLTSIESTIEDSNFSGTLGFLFSKDDTGLCIPVKKYLHFNSYKKDWIEISQKGIFVGNINDRRLHNVFGVINLLRKNEIDLGRYHIKDESKIQMILEKFYHAIINKLLDNWKTQTINRKYTLSRDFISNYLKNYDEFEKFRFIEPFLDHFYLQIYRENKIEYLSINETFKINEFVLVRKETPFEYNDTNPNLDRLYSFFEVPLIVEHDAYYISWIFTLIKGYNRNIFVKFTNKHCFIFVKSNQQGTTKELTRNTNLYKFDAPYICAYTNLLIEVSFNFDNIIIKYYCSNEDAILKNQELNGYFYEFFKELKDFAFEIHSSYPKMENPIEEVKYLNSILDKINLISGTSFVLQSKDFPSWVNKRIGWK